MTTFTLSLLGILFKATLVLVVAFGLIRLANWRRLPVQRLILLTSLGLLMLLRLGVLIELPWRWELDAPPRIDSPSVETTNRVEEGIESHAAADPSGFDLAQLARWFATLNRHSEEPRWRFGWGAFGCVYLAGIGFGLVRLGRSVIRLRRLTWRLRPIADSTLQSEVDAFARTLGINQRIRIFECDEAGLIATFGCFRAVIVLPPEWRIWSDRERHAALAHELSHIRHRDFLLGIAMQLIRAIYFIHPMIYWLQRELHWQQEIDADALAVSLLQDRQNYRKSLAMLALRRPTDGSRQQVVLMPSLTGSILLRRFDMLRMTDANRTISHWWKKGLFLVLTALGVTLASLQSPASPKDKATGSKELPPFDLTYLRPEAKSILAIRPCEFLSQPGTETFAKKLDGLYRETLKKLSIEIPADLKLENIEQIVTEFHLATQGTGKPGSRSLSLGSEAILIRMKLKFDWLGFIKTLPVGVNESEIDGKKYYEMKPPLNLIPLPIGFFLPDDRSLVLLTSHDKKQEVKKRFEKFGALKKLESTSLWKTLNSSAVAMTLDNADGEYSKKFEKDLALRTEAQAFVDSIASYSLGLELGDDRPIRIIIDAAKDADLEKLQTRFKGYINLARGVLQTEIEDMDLSPMALKLFLEVTEEVKLKVDGERVEFQGFSKLRVKDYLEDLEKQIFAEK